MEEEVGNWVVICTGKGQVEPEEPEEPEEPGEPGEADEDIVALSGGIGADSFTLFEKRKHTRFLSKTR